MLILATAPAVARVRAISVTADGDRPLGHPLDALAWLANRRSRLGLGLATGTFRIEVEALEELSVTVE